MMAASDTERLVLLKNSSGFATKSAGARLHRCEEPAGCGTWEKKTLHFVTTDHTPCDTM